MGAEHAEPIEMRIGSAAATEKFGAGLACLLSPGDVLILDGPLGAGKTTLTRGIASGLGVQGPITSPTFVIARVHPSLAGGLGMVHVDAYRLSSLDDVDALDLDASLADSVTVVEWGKGRVEQLADSWLQIEFVLDEDDEELRILKLRTHGESWDRRHAALTALAAHSA